jgi:hypothetical protein
MLARGSFALAPIPLALAVVLSGFNLPAAAQSFAITASPVTTGSSGVGSIQYTVSGIPFDGTLVVGCQYAGEESFQAQDRLPVCGAGPAVGFTVTTGQTITKTISLIPWGSPMPVAQHRAPHKFHPVLASGFLFAGALLFGIGFGRRRRAASLLLPVLGALAIASGVSACGGSPAIPPPGTYPYTLTAGLNSNTPAILTASTTATVQVTIP